MRRPIAPAAILLACATLFAASLLTAQSTHTAARPAPVQSAPDFTRPALDGKIIHLSSYRGKLVLLNFWATWCAPCVAEIPRFSAWQTRFAPQGLQVIGISMDDDLAPVNKFTRRYQPTYPILMGDEHIGDLYGGVLGLPVTYLIGAQGQIIAKYQGEANLNEMEGRITEALRSLPPAPKLQRLHTPAHRR